MVRLGVLNLGSLVIALGILASCSFSFLVGCSLQGCLGPISPNLCGELAGGCVVGLLVSATGAVTVSVHGPVDMFYPLVAVLDGTIFCFEYTSLGFGCTNCMVVPW